MKKRKVFISFLVFSIGCISIIWILFAKQPTDHSLQQHTTIVCHQDSVNWGKFRYAETKNAVFEIKNTGDHPLIIKNIETYCGCTEAKWNTKPVLPGQTKKIQITFKPNSLGYFSKSIQLFCNIPSQTYNLRISGFVEE